MENIPSDQVDVNDFSAFTGLREPAKLRTRADAAVALLHFLRVWQRNLQLHTKMHNSSNSESGTDLTISDPHRQSPHGDNLAQVRGKFLFVGDRQFLVRGVTYGAFRPDANGLEYQDRQQIDRDFTMMSAAGINLVRIPHAVPPAHLLDAALGKDLRVMVGLSAEQYVGYLIDSKGYRIAEVEVLRNLRSCVGHPAILCYALGNEIPAAAARWLGPAATERYLRRLFLAVKKESPTSLVTYVNYPTTEYLILPFLDFVCFNLYLENEDRLKSYIARLHNLAGDRPLIISEMGLDAIRNGSNAQATSLARQIDATFRSGCAGGIVFSWTDEWYRGGAEVDGWAFGLTDKQRVPKPSLHAVKKAFAEVPIPPRPPAPYMSVVVCTYNGGRTIEQCLVHLEQLAYPSYEVIVVDDGSTDCTAEIAERFGVRLIKTTNNGLSAARNTGMRAAAGEIVAYIDDDAYPDPDWLTYLSNAFADGEYAAVGGPNLPPKEDGFVAQMVAKSPGGPTHVLLTDTTAEHIPGCNMAIRKQLLQAVGGFDPIFRIAGDDVDLCLRLRERGWHIGFCPAAVVWHHRRSTVRAYLRQQRLYGEAEALLRHKWPQHFNSIDHMSWVGRIYMAGLHAPPGLTNAVHFGVWGTAPFQSLYSRPVTAWTALPEVPEWHLVNAAMVVSTLLGFSWKPLFAAAPLLCVSLCWQLAIAIRRLRYINFGERVSGPEAAKARLLVVWLSVVQPIARLSGRLNGGISPWRWHVKWSGMPRFKTIAFFTQTWVDPQQRLSSIERTLQAMRSQVVRGGAFDRWDLLIHDGNLAKTRIRLIAEDQGSGTQYIRVEARPALSSVACLLILGGIAASMLAADSKAPAAAIALGLASVLLALRVIFGLSDIAHRAGSAVQLQEHAEAGRGDRPHENRS